MDKCINLNCAFRYYCSKRNTDKQFTPPCQADRRTRGRKGYILNVINEK